MRPFIFVLAGVNGAGKSSVGGAMLKDHGLTWLNPDAYARKLVRSLGISQSDANARAWQFSRARLTAAMDEGRNHAFETTLGGDTITRLLAQASGTHEVVMIYCGLSTAEQHIARVAQRVAQGGHPIAEDRIRERWTTSRLNLIRLMPSLAQLQVFDNSVEAAVGAAVPDPALLLHVQARRVLLPDASDAVALRATPAWARPIVEAALQG